MLDEPNGTPHGIFQKSGKAAAKPVYQSGGVCVCDRVLTI